MQHTTTALAAMLLAGCASFSPDGGFDKVSQLVQERSGHSPQNLRSAAQAGAARARVAELLQQPLSADSAAAIALLNNPGLQAQFAGLGIAEADLVQAGRPANPVFALGRLQSRAATEIDRGLVFDLLGLLTLPQARQAGRQRFAQAQLRAASQALAVVDEARKAWYGAVAAQQLLAYQGQVQEAADAASELAQRMARAGNFSRLAQLREQAFQAEAAAQLLRARQQALVAHERLARVLGMDGAQPAFSLPPHLPDLPPVPAPLQQAEQMALDHRLDLRLAGQATEAAAAALALIRRTSMLGMLHAGYQNKSTTGEARSNGWEIGVALPVFDAGDAGVARAEAAHRQAVQQAAQLAIDARSQEREAHAAYSHAHALARHQRDEVLPLRKRMSDENLLRYNGMLLSVFDLLADARGQIAAVTASVEALRDHWLAHADLQAALAGSRSAAATAWPSTALSNSAPANQTGGTTMPAGH